jgi:hypothetical protein
VVSSNGPPTPIEITPRTLELLELRTAADAILYRETLTRRGMSEQQGRRLAESAFAQQLVRLGHLLGGGAATSSDRQPQLLEPPAAAIETIATAVPDGEPVIVVEDQQWGLGRSIGARRVIPFLERDGEYWGPPADSATALRELTRLRGLGVRFIAFGRPSFWWLDHYVELKHQLESGAACLARSEDIIVFDIDDGTGSRPTTTRPPP